MARWIASLALLAVAGLVVAPSDNAQSAGPRPEFDAASIRLNPNCGERRGRGGGFSASGYGTSCVPLRVLIRVAYAESLAGSGAVPRQSEEVLGGPAWLDSELYDINAIGTNAASLGRARAMLRTLLEDRFQLKIHKEAREVPVYSLTVAKGGPKMQRTKVGSTCRPNVIGNFHPAEPAEGEPVLPLCGNTSVRPNGSAFARDGQGVTMDQLARGMLASLDRAVIDRTGLAGLFDVHLEYVPDNPIPVGPRNDGTVAAVEVMPAGAAGPSIFTAVQEQLGLKLSADRGPVEVLVIDSVERSSEN